MTPLHHDPNDGPLEEFDRMVEKSKLQSVCEEQATAIAPYFRTIYRLEARIERQQAVMCWMIVGSFAAGVGACWGFMVGVLGR